MGINLATCDTLWRAAFLDGFSTAALRVTVVEGDGLSFLSDFLDHEDLYRFLPELENPDQAKNWLSRAFGNRSYLFFRMETRQDREPAGFMVFNRKADGSLVLGGSDPDRLPGQGIRVGSPRRPPPFSRRKGVSPCCPRRRASRQRSCD